MLCDQTHCHDDEMALRNPALASSVQQRDLIVRREISAVELLEACLTQHAEHNPELNAVVFTNVEQAKADAAAADAAQAAGQQLGPLHGLPITIKDSIDVAGAPSTWGDPAHADYFPTEDADVVKQLKAAGAIVYGKTNVPKHLGDWQSFNEIYGRTNNPWDVARSAGGSSGGAAVAVATGMSSFEVGSDIGGSIRWPSNYNGLAGLKTSCGLVSQHGHSFPRHEGIVDNNVLGPIARTVGDLSLVLPEMWQPHMTPPPATQTSLSDFTVGVLIENPLGEQDDAVTTAIESAVAQLVDAGVTVAEGPDLEMAVRGHKVGLEIGRAAASGPAILATANISHRKGDAEG